jgi:hypothetical protein
MKSFARPWSWKWGELPGRRMPWVGLPKLLMWRAVRRLMLADFHWRAAMLLAIFQSCFVSQMEPLRDQLGFELSYLRGLVLVIGVLRTLVIWKRSNVQNWSPPVVAQLIGRSGEDWSPPVAQGLSFGLRLWRRVYHSAFLDRPSNCCRLWRRAHRFCVLF